MMQSTHLERSASLRASPTRQVQTDHVVLEAFYKTVELVLMSRVHFAAGAAPRNTRLHFDMVEVPCVREAMAPVKANVHDPLFLDISMGDTLLERWQLTYSTSSALGATVAGDYIAQLRKVVQQLAILLRSLFCLVRILPAFHVSQQLKFQQEDLGHALVGLSYHLGQSEAQMPLQFDTATTKQQYSFQPVDTMFGVVKVRVTYRKQTADVLAAIEQMAPPSPVANDVSPTLEHAIIQDYVPTTPQTKPAPSPLLGPARMVVQEDDDHRDAIPYATSQPMPIPHLATTAVDTPSYPRRDSAPPKQAHSLDAPELLRRPSMKPASVLETMAKASFQTPPLHPNSAPVPIGTPVRAMAPLDGFQLDGKFRPCSADSDKSSSSSSTQLPFSVATEKQRRTTTPPFFSSSPPFRALAGEAPSASPQNVPATRLQFHPTRDAKHERRRSESFEVASGGSSVWGIAPSVLDLGCLSPLESPLMDEATLPFALSSSAKVEVGSFLQQLKQAPPLHVATTGRPLATVDQELAFFRQLRDDMTHDLQS
ncbi:hypothetical protein SPRG_01226 [Saprolegnia parasitica CBS 223.65]|uniref:Autophagy-related protein 13 N-terminal domain-containing protein n=1 Tax=Saprolegnia parasitica (strain CBS 223.65) TaxID=695850 RepID=A0A067CTU9_SAPPC|nr:hypothetical protein SPRG_01226 [Saprolegnia parasitica CBS 223.65]KDO33948.1 hypothetical protein SPRG_01226 [Saprolegnia parasitica CBS 223.65]|eukprot:XP_012194841.1 hypothetical protein SPRG_01226 [Saprolegnia parasitica CBS 223.65]